MLAQGCGKDPRLHIICERDVGLFSLIQQVIANIPWALQEGRVPIAYFRDRTCYWTPEGYHGKDTVWEYYFEPIFTGYPVARIPKDVRARIDARFPSQSELGYFASPSVFVSNHFGDHPELEGKSLVIPYSTGNPDNQLRRQAAAIIRRHVRPRAFLLDKAEAFYRARMLGEEVIGVHIRGTDAVSTSETRAYRSGSLSLTKYRAELERLTRAWPNARILVATDEEASLEYVRETFGSRVIAYEARRHEHGEPAGRGPTGHIMPAYVAADRAHAVQNGEEAIIEYLLLRRASRLVHNGASLATTVLLAEPSMPQTNTHQHA